MTQVVHGSVSGGRGGGGGGDGDVEGGQDKRTSVRGRGSHGGRRAHGGGSIRSILETVFRTPPTGSTGGAGGAGGGGVGSLITRGGAPGGGREQSASISPRLERVRLHASHDS
jgi:hypothetical protein